MSPRDIDDLLKALGAFAGYGTTSLSAKAVVLASHVTKLHDSCHRNGHVNQAETYLVAVRRAACGVRRAACGVRRSRKDDTLEARSARH